MRNKPTLQELKDSTSENWESLFKKARQSDLIQLRLNESKGQILSRACVELERRKMNLDRTAIIIAALSLFISVISMFVAVNSQISPSTFDCTSHVCGYLAL